MKFLFLLPVCFFANASYGQFAVVSDKDGHTNIRKDATLNSVVMDKLQNGHIIYCLENKGHWTNIDYTRQTKDRNGYIYSDRYKAIAGYLSIPISGKTENSVRLSKDSIEVIVTEQPFNKTKHVYKYYKDADDQIELIDNKKYWGRDGGMPATEYQTITVKIGRSAIRLPVGATANLFEPNIYNTRVNFDKERNIIYIQSMNSDGAGGYEVIWKIENGVYKERFIAYGF